MRRGPRNHVIPSFRYVFQQPRGAIWRQNWNLPRALLGQTRNLNFNEDKRESDNDEPFYS